MEIVVAATYEDMARKVAELVEAWVVADPSCTLGLATGSTMIGVYGALVADYRAGKLSFADVDTYNLDEYCGLTADDPQSYRYFMKTNLFDHIDIDPARTHLPDGASSDAEASCIAYEAAIEEHGGIDLQLLGIGHNGHIGFNEPDSFFPNGTHTVELTDSTRQANSRLFNSIDEVPTHACTMGIGTIMRARSVVLAASGADKAAIIKAALTGPVTPEVPASILQFHPHVTVVVDEAAASELA